MREEQAQGCACYMDMAVSVILPVERKRNENGHIVLFDHGGV